jgi:hypothetical protein
MVAIGHNNLGNAARGLRDYDDARAHFAASLETYRHYEDYWALAFLLEDIAVLAIEVGDGIVACELLGAADSLRDEIGSPRGPSLDSELDTHVAEVSRALGSGPARAARQRGKALTPAPAIDRALRFARRLESAAQP